MRRMLLIPIVLCSIAVTAVCAQDNTGYRFAGATSGITKGNINGLINAYRVCQADFGPDARMCRSVEIQLSPNITRTLGGGVWVQPVYRSGISGDDTVTGLPVGTCAQWRSESASESGLAFNRFNSGQFQETPCSESQPVACCLPADQVLVP